MAIANQWYPGRQDERSGRELWNRVNSMQLRLEELGKRLAQVGTPGLANKVAEVQVQLAAVQDALTSQSTFVGARGTNFTSVPDPALSASGDGFTITGTAGSGVVSITGPATARSALGLGALAVLGPAADVPNSGVVAGAGYVQADFQSVIDTLNDLLTSLRTGGLIA